MSAPGWSGPQHAAKTNTWAIVSLVFGLVGLVGFPVSVVCGIIGLNKAKTGHGGRGMAIAGLALSALWVLAVVGTYTYYAAIGAYEPEMPRLHAGDCIEHIPRAEDTVPDVVNCSDEHSGEVVAVLTMPDIDAPRKGVFDEYEEECATALAAYAPDANDSSSISLHVRYPTMELWSNGNRDVTCVAALRPPRTGSVKR